MSAPAARAQDVDVTVHHIAVQVASLKESIAWYEEFFACSLRWSLCEFSATSMRRLPGMTTLAELTVGGVRLHLFERDGSDEPGTLPTASHFQHVCLEVPDRPALVRWREAWSESYHSGRWTFRRAEPATEIEEDADGTASFYAFDINGVEYEFVDRSRTRPEPTP